MKVPRTLQISLVWLLNNSLPPMLRDSRLLMAPLMRIVFGEHAPMLMEFKQRAMSMTQAEYVDFYRQLAPLASSTETDLNRKCTTRILEDVAGSRVLEVGCGRGYLARKLCHRYDVTACDIVIDEGTRSKIPAVKFFEGDIEKLPFAEGEFETVVCTHTLEHTRDLFASLTELRRVASRRLIIVVPKERPYRYTFNAHLHFFPYRHTLQAAMGTNRSATCDVVGGDLLYVEDV